MISFFRQTRIFSQIQNGNGVDVGAGNTFSTPSTVSHWHHVAGANSNAPVKYIYDNPADEPVQNILNVVTSQGTSVDCSTMSNFGIDKLDENEYEELNITELNSMKSQFYDFESDYNTFYTLYVQLLDNGNTEALVEEIENASIDEQLGTRSDFLALSPYVSQRALKELASAQIVSHPILLEILLENPDATRDENFIKFLEYDMPGPLPAYMIDLVRASWAGPRTARNHLLQDINTNIHQMTILKNHIILTYFLNDTLRSEDSAWAWRQKVPSIRNSYENLEYLLYKGNVSMADSILDSLTVRFKFSARDSIEHAAFLALYTFKKELLSDSIEINQLDSSRIDQLKAIADAEEYTFPRSMARSALCFFYHICYPDTVRELPGGSAKAPPIKKYAEKAKEVEVYPNPAKDYLVCHYSFINITNAAKAFTISDITGKQVYSIALTGQKGQHIVDTRNYSNGNYIFTLSTSNGEKYSGKFVIQK